MSLIVLYHIKGHIVGFVFKYKFLKLFVPMAISSTDKMFSNNEQNPLPFKIFLIRLIALTQDMLC